MSDEDMMHLVEYLNQFVVALGAGKIVVEEATVSYGPFHEDPGDALVLKVVYRRKLTPSRVPSAVTLVTEGRFLGDLS